MEINSLCLYAIGFSWGWIFLPIIALVAEAADFTHQKFVSRLTSANLWGFKVVTFAAFLTFASMLYWWLSQRLLTQGFQGRGREFAASLLMGFFAFLILPRIENIIRGGQK